MFELRIIEVVRAALPEVRTMTLAFNVTQHDALWVLIILAILCALVWLWKHR